MLWIRSTDWLSPSALKRELHAIGGVVFSGDFAEALFHPVKEFRSKMPIYLVFAGVFIFLLGSRRSYRARLTLTSPATAVPRAGGRRIAPTLAALGYTLLLAVPLPLLAAFWGWRIQEADPGIDLYSRMSATLFFIASGLAVFMFACQTCAKHGLGEAHFQWPAHNMRLLHRHLTWVIPIAVFIGFFSSLFEGLFADGLSNRVLFIPAMILVALLAYLLFRPVKGLQLSESKETREWLRGFSIRKLYPVFAMALPVLLALSSVAGYTYTARKFWMFVVASIGLLLLVKFVSSFSGLWISLVRRNLLMEQARKRRAAQAEAEAQQAKTPHDPDSLPAPVPVPQEAEINLDESLAQSRRLLRTLFGIITLLGLWTIWSDMLPALKALDRVPLWEKHAPAAATTDSTSPGSGLLLAPNANQFSPQSGSPSSLPDNSWITELPARNFVSVGDLGLALLLLLLSFIASSNLPGFLEMTVLSRMRLRTGEGYAVTTILRYIILLVGFVVAARMIGLTWNSVQWLAAAVTVGIGFGLQEIFANFVSGLIILFERPIRLGDIVTVGDISGQVSRIQIRATTIRDWDNKELILPNREFITGRFVNWSLTDAVVRLVCRVGLSYGADVRVARDLLLEAAEQNPRILKSPRPSALFRDFGDSTLNFDLRGFVDNPDIRLEVMHELNVAILDAFRKAGIEIAFPQRDLHIRTLPENFNGMSGPAPSPASPS